MAVYSMLCTDGLLLHLVGKGQLLVYSGLHTVMVNSGTQFGKVIIKVACRARVGCPQGARKANTPPCMRQLSHVGFTSILIKTREIRTKPCSVLMRQMGR